MIGAYLGGLSFEHEDGRLATTQSKFGSKKNGIEYRSAPMRFTTRWIVDTNRSFDQRCSMAWHIATEVGTGASPWPL